MEHGHGGYTNHKCRCPVCKKATAEYQRAYQIAYRRKNREKKRTYSERYNEEQRDHLRAMEVSPRGKELRRHRSLRRRGQEALAYIENVDPRIVYEMHGGRCGICGQFVSEDNFHVDHVTPLARGGLHAYINCQPAHPTCNLSKGARTSVRPA